MTQVTEEQAVDVALDHLRSALDLLDQIDPDALTPREALERLYELKRLAAAA